MGYTRPTENSAAEFQVRADQNQPQLLGGGANIVCSPSNPPQPSLDSPYAVAVSEGIVFAATSNGLLAYTGDVSFGTVQKGSFSAVAAGHGFVAYGGAVSNLNQKALVMTLFEAGMTWAGQEALLELHRT